MTGIIKLTLLRQDFLNTVPGQKKSHIVTWKDFRKARQERLNEYNRSQSLAVFVPSTWRIFPLPGFGYYTELGHFKVIQDDCNDMVDFLKNVKKLSPVLLLILFSRIDEIDRRFHYLIGHQWLKYRIRKKYIQGPGAAIKASGQTTIKRVDAVLEKYGGIVGYDKMQRGKKKDILKEIQEKVRLKDERQIYNILRKIREGN